MRTKLQVPTADYRYFAWGDKLVPANGLGRSGTFLAADPSAFGTPNLIPGTDQKEVKILWP
jgi:hypothetical protein